MKEDKSFVRIPADASRRPSPFARGQWHSEQISSEVPTGALLARFCRADKDAPKRPRRLRRPVTLRWLSTSVALYPQTTSPRSRLCNLNKPSDRLAAVGRVSAHNALTMSRAEPRVFCAAREPERLRREGRRLHRFVGPLLLCSAFRVNTQKGVAHVG